MLPKLYGHRAEATVKGHLFLIVHKGITEALPPSLKSCARICIPSLLPHHTAESHNFSWQN